MRDPAHWLLGFDGRIGRRAFWLGLVIVAIVGSVDQALSGVVKFAVGLLALWMFWALVAKRCHDRGRSAWAAVAWLAPHIVHWLILVAPLAGVGALAAGVFGLAAGLGLGAAIVGIWWLAGAVWFVATLGVLSGDRAPNRFGAPPAA